MNETEEKKSNNWFLVIMIVCCVIVVLVSFYFFYFKKDFDFIVETQCDPSVEECFERDCTNPDDCPPNGLSDFKRYRLNANDFKACVNEDCTQACETGAIKCTQVACTENTDVGESCISPVVPLSTQ